MLASLKAMGRHAGKDRISVAPPQFEFEQRLNSNPLTIEDLPGQRSASPLVDGHVPPLR